MLRLVEKSSVPAVTLEEMVDQLRREDTEEDDDYIEACIATATDWVERYTGLSLISATWDEYFNFFPATTGALYLSRAPLIEIEGIYYRDTAEIAFTGFLTDVAGGSAYLPVNGLWPTTDGSLNAVRVRYRAGFVDLLGSPVIEGDVPEILKHAIKIYASWLYGNREEASPEDALKNMLRADRVTDSLA